VSVGNADAVTREASTHRRVPVIGSVKDRGPSVCKLRLRQPTRDRKTANCRLRDRSIIVSPQGAWITPLFPFHDTRPERPSKRQISKSLLCADVRSLCQHWVPGANHSHEVAFHACVPCNVVPTPSNGDVQSLVPCKVDGGTYVILPGALDNHSRPAVETAIPDLVSRIVVRITRKYYSAPNRGAQSVDVRVVRHLALPDKRERKS
jgi:hypothetical protein